MSDVQAIGAIIADEYSPVVLVEKLRGRKGGLRPSKPKNDGLLQYIWRMARFHSGDDPSMPMTADWDLSDWLESRGFEKVHAIRTDRDRELLKHLDALSTVVLVGLGRDPFAGARRWGKALGMVR
jgi:hypothetical protein